MSKFGFYEKDNLVDAIQLLAASERERERGKGPRKILESIMEAVTCGLDSALCDLRGEKVEDDLW